MIDYERELQAAKLRGSFLEFVRFFFEYITHRKFIISTPIGRESHHITLAKVLTQVYNLQILREIINIPPGHGKSTFLSMWVAWCWATYPDSNFLYISYAQELAAKHTAFIRSIVLSKMYSYLFDVSILGDSRAKDSFQNTAGGSVRAFGSAGSITGHDAGLPGLDRFSGALIIDDAHKPDEVHSDTLRERPIRNYDETARQRCRGILVPIVYLGQRTHEYDLPGHFLSGNDVDQWHSTILKSLDEAGNALYPEIMPKERLLELQEKTPYVFAAQHQQDPLPSGGGLFKREWFTILDEEPALLSTFITVDTAETEKSWNDATVFSFWGIYEIQDFGKNIGKLGLHWIDCLEIRIEPKDLKNAFIDFYIECNLHAAPPTLAAIEKKSTGVTLISVLSELRGLEIRQIERAGAASNKTQRFIDIQGFVASKQISFTKGTKHIDNCVNHMGKITANNTHRHDDIADTLADAIKIALIEKSIFTVDASIKKGHSKVLEGLNISLRRKIEAGAARNANFSEKVYR